MNVNEERLIDPAHVFERLGLTLPSSGPHAIRGPIDGTTIGSVQWPGPAEVDGVIGRAVSAFEQWRLVPAPRRGELVRLLAEELRAHKQTLGALVTLEVGKIPAEGDGEVQEMIDVCDYAVGLSRQLYGLTIASERPGHVMREAWLPLGPVAVITAFNFPVAVWSWNAALALVCGNPVIWKPSDKTPFTALAVQGLVQRVINRFPEASPALSQVVLGGADVGARLADEPRIALVSATGSTRMGRAVAPRVAARFGRSLLELGGNNAMIVTPSADLDLAVRAITFSAVGTCGQRCTSLRRLIVHESIRDELVARLRRAYDTLPIGNPQDPGTLVGPLIDNAAFRAFRAALDEASANGGTVHGGERVLADELPGGFYVRPAIVEMPAQNEVVRRETFGPILYVMDYFAFSEAIVMHNAVPQGLSSCIFTTDLREAEVFASAAGSDCGIVNVNIGPSGAEIGGAFGGEKETGGGRESGSDSWRAYMRRVTTTVNYSGELPLAQGIVFGSDR